MLRSRVAGERGLNIADQQRANTGQLRAELARDFERDRAHFDALAAGDGSAARLMAALLASCAVCRAKPRCSMPVKACG